MSSFVPLADFFLIFSTRTKREPQKRVARAQKNKLCGLNPR